MTMRARLLAALPALAALLATAPAARGAGVGRPTVASARAYGMGGAFTAVADDPLALHYNPAGMALQPRDSFLFGVNTALPLRSYTPIGGEAQEAHATPNYLPVLGYTTRLSSHGMPSRLALGVAFLNTMGGAGSWDSNPDIPKTIDDIQLALLEVVPGLAYEVNDLLTLGVGLRFGLGLFSITANERPLDASFSSMGFGAGASLGVMVRPVEGLQFGLVYRTSISVSESGTGEIANVGGMQEVDVSASQRWPQSAALGVAYRFGPRLLLSAQVDWVDWSSFDHLDIDMEISQQIEQMDFADALAVHAGGEVGLTPRLALRAGVTHESNAIPARTMQRQYLTGPLNGVAVGGGYQITRGWRVDGALECLLGADVNVPDNTVEYGTWNTLATGRANLAPGDYTSTLLTLEVNAQYQF